MHMDFRSETVNDLHHHRRRAEALGAGLLHDRSRDDTEPTYVLADPADHPFCLQISPRSRLG